MSNLLPYEARKRAWGTMRDRMALVASLAVAGGVAAAVLALAPSFGVLYVARARAPQPAAPAAPGGRVDTASLAKAQATLTQLALLSATTSPSELLRISLAARPAGVIVDRVSYGIGKPPTVTLSGVALNPEVLGAYRDALSRLDSFSRVSVPIAALVGSQDGRFTITLSVR